LEETGKEKGPGFIFQDFIPNEDQSLRLAVYPFNALDNPRCEGDRPQWFAFLSNDQFLPFLKSRFPGSQWYGLSEHLPTAYGGMVLGVIPLNPSNGALLQEWQRADAVLKESNRVLQEWTDPDPRGRALDLLMAHQADFQDDPFLRSVFGDKVQMLYAQKGDLLSAVEVLERTVQGGYRVPYLYQWLAQYLKEEKQDEAAEKAYRQALELVFHPVQNK
jgi:hypothetical protein